MKEWKDWLTNEELNNKVYEGILSIPYDRLQKFAEAIEDKFKDDDNWVMKDIAEDLKLLNSSIRGLTPGMDYVWILDCWENDGTFQPNKESFSDCIKRIERWTGIQL